MTPEPNGYYYKKCGRRGVTSSTPFRITGLVSIIWSQYIFLKNKGVVRDCILKLRLPVAAGAGGHGRIARGARGQADTALLTEIGFESAENRLSKITNQFSTLFPLVYCLFFIL